MMNAIAKVESARPSLIATMASKFNMDPKAFEATVRSTVMPSQHTNEQFAALMMVAKEYDLNPLTKEIYAFPAKGGGIVPVVSIDGWVNLVNSHPACDGFEFDFEHADGKLISCTCRMYRKDRGRPVTVTEYLAECKRNTDPWKMEHRMLRHKAMIQAARYAFGFSGIYDEDEGSKIAEMRDVTPAVEARQTPPAPPKPPAPPSAKVIEAEPDQQDEQPMQGEFDLGDYLEQLETSLASAKDGDAAVEIWNDFDAPATLESYGHADMIEATYKIRDRAFARFEPLMAG